MWYFLGMAYLVGGTFCSIIVVAACVVHGRAARNAPAMPTLQTRYVSSATECQTATPTHAQDADNSLVIHPI